MLTISVVLELVNCAKSRCLEACVEGYDSNETTTCGVCVTGKAIKAAEEWLALAQRAEGISFGGAR